MIEQRGGSVTITGRPLLGAVYRAVLLGIARRRANGLPSTDLQVLARLLRRAYMSPQRHEMASVADTPASLNDQQSRDDWVTTAEAANILRLSRRTVQRMAKAPGGLDAIRVGRTHLIRLSALLALADQRKKAS